MAKKIILTADATCDLGEELIKKTGVKLIDINIALGDESYLSEADLSTEKIFDTYRKKKILPKTSATTVLAYSEVFSAWTDKGYDVIHIGLSGAISSTYNNSYMASKEVGNVYTVDSKNLSSGMGIVVMEAAKRIEEGMEASLIQKELNELTEKVNVSFVLETLEYMSAGGRCSSAAALGANLLNIKPCIEVKKSGKMDVGKKYRGDMKKVIQKYISERLSDIDNVCRDKIFITHTCVNDEYVDTAREALLKTADFENIYVTKASTTITAHCGPNTLGIIFLEK